MHDRTGNLRSQPGIFPDYAAPIVRNTAEGRELTMARWGVPSSKQAPRSGGDRIVTFFTGHNLPVFLITVLGKNEQANLTRSERNTLAGLTKVLVAEYRNKVVKVGAGK